MDPLRVALYIDGFNLYHSIDELGQDRLKWLSLWDLGLRIIRTHSERLVSCEYFSAFANHLQARRPDVVQRHQDYVSALQATGVKVTLGNFKRKQARCLQCKAAWYRHEEKETDVNIAVAIVGDAYENVFDVAYVLSADTDLAPAMRRVRSITSLVGGPPKQIVAVFPPIAAGRFRHVSALQQNSDRNISLNVTHLQACRLPNEITSANGQLIVCPTKYL